MSFYHPLGSFNTNGWREAGEIWVYATTNTFTITGQDKTDKYTRGTLIKLTNDGSVKYFFVRRSTFSTDTTVTIEGGTDYTLANASITDPFYSYESSAEGYPDHFNWTPTFGGSGSMSYSNVSINYAVFRNTGGNIIWFQLYAVGTTGGVASNGLTFTVPTTMDDNSPLNSGFLGASKVFDGGAIQAAFVTNLSTTNVVQARKVDMSNYALTSGVQVHGTCSYRF